VKIDVPNFATYRRVLHFLNKGGAIGFFTGDLKFNQKVFSGSVAHHCIDVPRGELQGLRFVFGAVNDRWDNSARF